MDRIKAAGVRVKLDDSDGSPGWKFAEHEMRGVPLRIELGPKDLEEGKFIAVRRDNGEKLQVALAEAERRVPELLDDVQRGLFDKAKRNLEDNTHEARTLPDARQIIAEHGGFLKTMWCGDPVCEQRMKDEAGVSSRCLPFEQEHLGDTCPVCGGSADKMVVWGVAY